MTSEVLEKTDNNTTKGAPVLVEYDSQKYVSHDLPKRIETKETVEELLVYMKDIDASDLFIYTNEPIWVKVHGRLYPATARKLKIQEVTNLASVFGGASTSAQLGSMKPVDTSFEIKQRDSDDKSVAPKRIRFRINCVGSLVDGVSSVSVSVRLLATKILSATELGVQSDITDVVLNSKQGLMIVAGGTGHGKSTLLAALIKERLIQPQAHDVLVTIESPVEYVYTDISKPTTIVTQMEVGRNISSFGAGVINSLRMTPTMIVVGEVRDQQTGEASIEASNTGHFVLCTLHANRVDSIVDRFLSLFATDSEKEKAKFSLITESKVLVAQRLVNTTDGKRHAIREYLVFSHDVVDYLLENSINLSTAMKHAVVKWGTPMKVDILKLYEKGLLSQRDKDRLVQEYV